MKSWKHLVIRPVAAYEPVHGLRAILSDCGSHAGRVVTLLGWYQFKLFLEHSSGISMDALHILVGFAILVLAANLLGRSLASATPWLFLLMLELANEAYDLHVEIWPNRASQLGEGVKDIMLTMALPTLVLLLARWKPALLHGDAGRPDRQSTTR
jgi:hypothetical protein